MIRECKNTSKLKSDINIFLSNVTAGLIDSSGWGPCALPEGEIVNWVTVFKKSRTK